MKSKPEYLLLMLASFFVPGFFVKIYDILDIGGVFFSWLGFTLFFASFNHTRNKRIRSSIMFLVLLAVGGGAFAGNLKVIKSFDTETGIFRYEDATPTSTPSAVATDTFNLTTDNSPNSSLGASFRMKFKDNTIEATPSTTPVSRAFMEDDSATWKSGIASPRYNGADNFKFEDIKWPETIKKESESMESNTIVVFAAIGMLVTAIVIIAAFAGTGHFIKEAWDRLVRVERKVERIDATLTSHFAEKKEPESAEE